MKYRKLGIIVWLLFGIIAIAINLGYGICWIAGTYVWETFVKKDVE